MHRRPKHAPDMAAPHLLVALSAKHEPIEDPLMMIARSRKQLGWPHLRETVGREWLSERMRKPTLGIYFR